jgi:hypothetical protein
MWYTYRMDTSPTSPQPMTVEEARAWAAAWGRAGPELVAERQAKSRRTPLWESIAALDDAFEAARESREPRLHSGFVEQQRLFARLR